jgi:hypothetical protein
MNNQFAPLMILSSNDSLLVNSNRLPEQSANFNTRRVTMVDQAKANSHPSAFLSTALKIIGIVTLILPLFVLLKACVKFIRHIYKKQSLTNAHLPSSPPSVSPQKKANIPIVTKEPAKQEPVTTKTTKASKPKKITQTLSNGTQSPLKKFKPVKTRQKPVRLTQPTNPLQAQLGMPEQAVTPQKQLEQIDKLISLKALFLEIANGLKHKPQQLANQLNHMQSAAQVWQLQTGRGTTYYFAVQVINNNGSNALQVMVAKYVENAPTQQVAIYQIAIRAITQTTALELAAQRSDMQLLLEDGQSLQLSVQQAFVATVQTNQVNVQTICNFFQQVMAQTNYLELPASQAQLGNGQSLQLIVQQAFINALGATNTHSNFVIQQSTQQLSDASLEESPFFQLSVQQAFRAIFQNMQRAALNVDNQEPSMFLARPLPSFNQMNVPNQPLIPADELEMINIEDVQNPSAQFALFLDQHHQQADRALIYRMAEKGGDLFKSIETADEAQYVELLNRFNQNSAKENKQSVCSMMWCLMATAAAQNKTFEEGAFIIKDPGYRIFNFLEKLPGAYQRTSSHLYEVSPDRHHGFDIHWDNEFTLPANKGHILFTRIEFGEPSVFIKLENYGLRTYYDLAGHGAEFFWSVGMKILPQLFGADDAEGSYKERIPSLYIKEFLDLIKEDPHVEAIKKAVGNHKGRGQGIGRMYRYVNSEIPPSFSQEQKQLLEKFKEKLEKDFGTENLEFRIGREVRLTPAKACAAPQLIAV